MPSEGVQLFSAFCLSRLYSPILASQFGVRRVAVLSNTARDDHPNREVGRQACLDAASCLSAFVAGGTSRETHQHSLTHDLSDGTTITCWSTVASTCSITSLKRI